MMPVDPTIQAELERDFKWKRAWPRCFLGLVATIEILFGLALFLTELFNILLDFWHMNVFGGIWASVLVLFNWILIYCSVCRTNMSAASCAFIWNIITSIGLGVLMVFDVIFILNPSTCILTPNCSSQPQIVSINSLMQLIPQFKNYTSYDSKKFFLEIQVGCAGVSFIISLIYIFIFIGCRIRIRNRSVQDYPIQPTAPLPPSAPLPQYEYPQMKVPSTAWTIEAPYTPN